MTRELGTGQMIIYLLMPLQIEIKLLKPLFLQGLRL
jgi:hypothetical protein